MTATLVTTVQHHIGLSTDEKPDDVTTGSTFYELDTRVHFVFDGKRYVASDLASVARVVIEGKITNGLLASMLDELKLISAHLEAIND